MVSGLYRPAAFGTSRPPLARGPVVELTPVTCVESVPNVSEGRDRAAIEACADAIRSSGACLLDVSSDATHHRSVFSFAGSPAQVAAAVLALFDTAVAAIDLRRHTGAHPRVGAVDVVPFVPIAGVTMAECVTLARDVARTVAARHDLPVFLYEAAASTPARRDLAEIRRGGLDGVATRLGDPAWAPDFGPARLHPSAGAAVIGARAPLIAFNVQLASRDVGVARRIARAIRTSSGGLPALKAMAVDLPTLGLVQVSMNLTDFMRTSIVDAFDAVAREAARAGVPIVDSEIVGLAPAAALTAAVAAHVRLRHDAETFVLERRLHDCGIRADSLSAASRPN